MTQPRSTFLLVGALCATAIAQSAAAQPYPLRPGLSADPSEVVTYTRVPYTDLDAGSPAGARILLQRIEAAADAVCGGAANQVSKRQREAYADCRGVAVASAAARMKSPALTALVSHRKAELRAAR